MIIAEELHIDCLPTTALHLIAGAQETTSWFAGISRAEMTSDGPIGTGSQFVSVMWGQ